MRIGGKEISGPNEEVLILPRLDGDVVIKAQAVADMSDFEKLVPEPKAPGKLTKDGWIPQTDDETYQDRLTRYNEQRFAYMAIISLQPSKIEWETVDLDNPKTWIKWSDELSEAGLSTIEVNRIVVCIMQANSLDESKLKEARELFLRGLEEADEKSSGLQIERRSLQSGEPVNDSESAPQESETPEG